MTHHQIGDMAWTEYSPDAVPAEVLKEPPVFPTHEDSQIYAVLQMQMEDSDGLGMCYREHVGSPLITRIRIRRDIDGDKAIFDVSASTIEQATTLFEWMLSEAEQETELEGFISGHVLTPNKNRGRYAAYCRMIRCQPLDKEV
jgi:hypothetical protein